MIDRLHNTSFQVCDNIIGGVTVKLKQLSSIRNKCHNSPNFVKKSKWKQSCYDIRSEREINENTREITLLFLAINVKTEGLGNRNEEDTIKNVKLYIVKRKGE